MCALSILARAKRQGVLCNLGEHTIQLARLGPVGEKPVVVDRLREVPLGNDSAIEEWVRDAADAGGGYTPAYCGFHPVERVLVRETVNARRLGEENYLATLFAESAKLGALKDWQVAAVNPLDGQVFGAATPSRPGLLFGLPRAAAREAQEKLCRLGLLPRRLELGTIVLLGALARYLHEMAYPHAVVVCEVGLTQTRVYFLGKDGVHVPAALPHGLRSIEETAMKELGVPDLGAAHAQLCAPTDELRAHGRRLVRVLTRHLKPAADYFEMQTGQPIGAVFCAHLPAPLGWLEEALAAAIDLEFLRPNLAEWLPRIGVQLAAGEPAPGASWFQALSLIGELAAPAHEAKP